MRAFVTGGHGFVGSWLLRHLQAAGDEIAAPSAEELDILDAAALAKALDAARPDAVYHLAGFAHVGSSWDRPAEVFRVNAEGTLNVLEGARLSRAVPRVLVVSSAEVYGRVGSDAAVSEDAPVRPVSPYAASKAAAEVLAVQAFVGRGVPAIIARPFNHTGPGQSSDFVVPAFAQRIASAGASGVLKVGNLSAARDVTDVRDVVRAYRLLVERGEPGTAYNVCRGEAVVIEDVVHRLLALAGRTDLRIEVDPELLRPADVAVLRGDPSRLTAATGWRPEIPLDQTLADVLAAGRAAP